MSKIKGLTNGPNTITRTMSQVLAVYMHDAEMDQDWFKYPRTMYKGKRNLPRVARDSGRIKVGQYGPRGPYWNDLDLYDGNSTFILFCMYFGIIDQMENQFNREAMTGSQRSKRLQKDLDNMRELYNILKK